MKIRATPRFDASGNSGVVSRSGLAFRLARREVRRHPWRHLLVVLMIAVPVLTAMVTYSAIATWRHIDNAQRSSAAYGSDAVRPAWTTYDEEEIAAAIASLPPGSTTATAWHAADWFTSEHLPSEGDGPRLVGVETMQIPDRLGASARFVATEGRVPSSGDEIFLTEALADIGRWRVGDVVESGRSAMSFTVAGIGVVRDDTEMTAALFPSAVPDSYWTSTVASFDQIAIDTRSSVNPTSGPEEYGVSVVDLASRKWIYAWNPQASPSANGLIGGFQAVTEDGYNRVDALVTAGLALVSAALTAIVAIVSSAAFAIASRRQLRNVGLLSAAGADPATIRASLVMQGAIPGLIAGALALVVGLGARWFLDANGTIEEATHLYGAHVVVSVGGVAFALLLGVAAGSAAAWFPARTASRVPLLSALAGRRPIGPVPTKVPYSGLAFVAGGCVGLALLVRDSATRMRSGLLVGALTPLVMILSVLAIVFGLIALGPTLVAAMGSLSKRTGGISRLALRGLARQRSQSAAAVAAVAVCLAVPVGLLTAQAWAQEGDQGPEVIEQVSEAEAHPETRARADGGDMTVMIGGDLRSDAAATIIARVNETVGQTTEVRVTAFGDGEGGWYNVASIQPDQVDGILAPWAAEVIRAGGVVALGGRAGPMILDDDLTKLSFDAVGSPSGGATQLLPYSADYLVPATVLDTIGIGRPPLKVALLGREPLSIEQVATIEEIGNPYELRSRILQPTLGELRAAAAAGPDAAPGPSSTPGVMVTAWPEIDYAGVAWPDNRYTDKDQVVVHSATNAYERVITAAAVASGALTLLVLAITLSLRAVDSIDDHRAAIAAGAPPARMRRQRALEGAVLALLGALLALPLGWLPVTAVRFGSIRRGEAGMTGAVLDRLALPGVTIVPILLAPAIAAGLLWLIVPAVRSGLRRSTPDQVLPRG